MNEVNIKESRYLIRYFDENNLRQIKVIFAEDIYKARNKAINMIGGVDKLINCHRLYNPTFSDEII